MNWPLLIFWFLAIISVVSGLLVVANPNPVRSALFLVMNFFVLSVFYFTLGAQFIGVVQVIVYAGAIMVLFLFVIMLLNLGAPDALKERGGLGTLVAIGMALIFLTVLAGAGAITAGLPGAVPTAAQLEASNGTVEKVGYALFDSRLPWLFPFEVTSILLLVGVVGAIILAKRKI